jgi:preprotein translocase subunit SecG
MLGVQGAAVQQLDSTDTLLLLLLLLLLICLMLMLIQKGKQKPINCYSSSSNSS